MFKHLKYSLIIYNYWAPIISNLIIVFSLFLISLEVLIFMVELKGQLASLSETTCEVIQIRLLLASKTRNLCSKGTAELNSTMTSLLSCGLSLFVLRGDPCKKSQVLSVAYGGLRSRVFPDLWSYLSIHKLKFLDRCIHTQKRYSCENLLMTTVVDWGRWFPQHQSWAK